MITISGADDDIDPLSLAALSSEFPFIEWGILISVKRAGTPRYPSREWRQHLSKLNLRTSLHLCGQCARDTLAGDFRWVADAAVHGFSRVQVNGFRDTVGLRTILFATAYGRMDWIMQAQSLESLSSVARIASECPGARVSALWDLSGGCGVPAKEWPMAPAGLRVGYAGGIGPDNVLDALGAEGSWIDMESGVRTDNRFDLVKVRRVLSLAAGS